MKTGILFGKIKNFLAQFFPIFTFAQKSNPSNTKKMEYGIGGTQGEVEKGSEGITELSKNRTMFITQLTDEAPYSPELIYDIKNMDEAFNTYKPNKEISFSMEDGSTTSEVIEFDNLGDFGPKGITKKSTFLNDLKQKEDQYRAISKELKSNKALQSILSNPETRQAFVDVIKSLVNDLEQAG